MIHLAAEVQMVSSQAAVGFKSFHGAGITLNMAAPKNINISVDINKNKKVKTKIKKIKNNSIK